MVSIRRNIILNYVNTLTGIIFPLITFPYAARVLLPEGIGIFNFHNSIIGYIILLSCLGIPMYAVREVSRCRDNITLRNKTTIEIILISIFLAFIGYIIVFLVGNFVPQLHSELNLFYVLSLSIIFSAIGISWFYQAVEDFRFITISGLIFRLLFTIVLFVFVKDKDDLLIYGLVYVGSTVGNSFINFIHLRKYISFSDIHFRNLEVWKHLKAAFHVFVLNLSVSFYVQLNPVMLGFLSDNVNVGFFSAGSKITHVILSVVTSMGIVLLPRASHLVESKQTERFDDLIRKSYHFYMFLCIPLMMGLIALAYPITIAFCGDAYTEASPVAYITAPIIVFISLTNLIGIQILYPQGKENLVILSTIVGAIVNLIINFLIIPLWGANGAAISTLIAEFMVLLMQVCIGRKYIHFRFFDKPIISYMIAGISMGLISFLVFKLIGGLFIGLIFSFLIGGIFYLLTLYFKKDNMLIEILMYIKLKK